MLPHDALNSGSPSNPVPTSADPAGRSRGSRSALPGGRFWSALVGLLLLASCGGGGGGGALGPAAPYQTLGPPTALPAQTVIAVYGDSRSNARVHAEVVAGIRASRPVAVFHTGDLTDDGSSAAEWKRFDEVTAGLRASTRFYPAVGNHDDSFALYAEHTSPPGDARWYSVRVGEIYFIVLDTNSPLEQGSEQLTWLEGELAAARDQAPFTVVVGHHPPFTTGSGHPDDEWGQRRTVVPLLEEYGAQLYLAGHNHNYERSASNGIFYLVTSGGGAPLYGQGRTSPYSQKFVKTYHFCRLWVADGRLQVEAQDLDDRVIDRFSMEPRPPADPVPAGGT